MPLKVTIWNDLTLELNQMYQGNVQSPTVLILAGVKAKRLIALTIFHLLLNILQLVSSDLTKKI